MTLPLPLRVAIGVVAAVLIFVSVLWLVVRAQTPRGAQLEPALEPTPAAATLDVGDLLTVVSWNLHYGCGPDLDLTCSKSREDVRRYLDQIGASVRREHVDIVALQEVDRDAFRTFGIDQLEYLRRATGLPYAAWTDTWNAGWVPSPGSNPRRHIGRVRSGQAILSKYPLRDPRRLDLPQPTENSPVYNHFYLHRALLTVDVELAPDLRVTVMNAHLEAFRVQNRMQHAAMVAQAVRDAEHPVLLLGDMNSIPPGASVRRGFPDEPDQDLTADASIATLRATGLAELAGTTHDDDPAWWTFPALTPNRRLDYIFFPPVLDLIEGGLLDEARPASDHRAVLGLFRRIEAPTPGAP